jgi:hypothetical protein
MNSIFPKGIKSSISYKIVTLKRGMPLFHITPLIDKLSFEDKQDRPYLLNVPPGTRYTTNLNDPMYFALTETFTKFYDPSGTSAHLKFKTIDNLKLIGLFWHKQFDIFNDYIDGIKFLRENNLDGYIGDMDSADEWLEIYLLDPLNKVSFVKEFKHSGTIWDDPKSYPKGDVDIINKNIIKSKTSTIKINKSLLKSYMGDYSKMYNGIYGVKNKYKY